MAEKKKSKLVVVLIIALVVVVAAAGIVIWKLSGSKNGGESGQNYASEDGTIGYDINANVYTSGDKAVSQGDGITVTTNYQARSDDGENFTCEVINTPVNALDMYIDLYYDLESMEQLYLSGLFRPGEGISSFKTNRKLPPGAHEAVLVLTLVEDDHKTLHSQTKIAMTLIVAE